jgi:hypothetical protein
MLEKSAGRPLWLVSRLSKPIQKNMLKIKDTESSFPIPFWKPCFVFQFYFALIWKEHFRLGGPSSIKIHPCTNFKAN